VSVYSMTGYANASTGASAAGAAALHEASARRSERGRPDAASTVEIRSVNGRFLDLALRLPDELRGLEPQLRAMLTARFRRGKIELRVTTAAAAESAVPEPSPEQLAAKLKLPVGKIELLLEAARHPASLEAPIGHDEEASLGHLVRDVTSPSPEEAAIRSQLAEEVERAMARLNDREREVLRLRYGLGLDRELSLEEIGRRLSVTRERVRQIEAKAMAKLRAANGHAA